MSFFLEQSSRKCQSCQSCLAKFPLVWRFYQVVGPNDWQLIFQWLLLFLFWSGKFHSGLAKKYNHQSGSRADDWQFFTPFTKTAGVTH
jgi:hypothetical protein